MEACVHVEACAWEGRRVRAMQGHEKENNSRSVGGFFFLGTGEPGSSERKDPISAVGASTVTVCLMDSQDNKLLTGT